MTALAIIAILLVIGALAYWIRQAHKQAMRDRKVFEPYPQAPSDHDYSYMEQQLFDSQVEREWRERVADNKSRRQDRREPPALLRRQAQ